MADNGIIPPPPFDSFEGAWLAMRDIIDQLGPLARAVLDEGTDGLGRPVGVDETPIAHELQSVPRLTLAVAITNGAALEFTRADERFTYWRATAPTTIKLVLVP